MRNRLRTLICWLSLLPVLCSCGADNYAKKGDALLAIGEYHDAAAEYRKAYTRTPAKERAKRGERAWKMAECYRSINYSARAVGAYQNALRYGYADTLGLLRLAQMQHRQGDYKNAAKNYQAYLDSFPNSIPAANGLEGATQAPLWRKRPSRYTVKNNNKSWA